MKDVGNKQNVFAKNAIGSKYCTVGTAREGMDNTGLRMRNVIGSTVLALGSVYFLTRVKKRFSYIECSSIEDTTENRMILQGVPNVNIKISEASIKVDKLRLIN